MPLGHAILWLSTIFGGAVTADQIGNDGEYTKKASDAIMKYRKDNPDNLIDEGIKQAKALPDRVSAGKDAYDQARETGKDVTDSLAASWEPAVSVEADEVAARQNAETSDTPSSSNTGAPEGNEDESLLDRLTPDFGKSSGEGGFNLMDYGDDAVVGAIGAWIGSQILGEDSGMLKKAGLSTAFAGAAVTIWNTFLKDFVMGIGEKLMDTFGIESGDTSPVEPVVRNGIDVTNPANSAPAINPYQSLPALDMG